MSTIQRQYKCVRIIDSFPFPFQKTHGEVDSKSVARPILDHRVPVSERIQGNLGTLMLESSFSGSLDPVD